MLGCVIACNAAAVHTMPTAQPLEAARRVCFATPPTNRPAAAPSSSPVLLREARAAISADYCLEPDVVNMIIRSQTATKLQQEARLMLAPMLPPGYEVGEVVGISPNPSSPSGVHLVGRVALNATRVQIRFNGGPYVIAPTTPTMPGHPRGFAIAVPKEAATPGEHRVYARALRSTGTVIGPLDNATSAAQFRYRIGP